MHVPTGPAGVFPTARDPSDIAYCIVCYDWERGLGPEWIEFAEGLFRAFDVVPHEGVGRLGGARSQGRYSRVRKRLLGFAARSSESAPPGFRINGPPRARGQPFFPCDLSVIWHIAGTGQKEALVAVREGLIESAEGLVERVGPRLFQVCGAAYAAAFGFPAVFGPEAYLASVAACPSGDTRSNPEYAARITRWRDNVWHRGLRARQGFLREVYPINFVVETHLNRRLNGELFGDFMRRVGTLARSALHDGVYQWVVADDRLAWVQRQLESSGLVLSSPYPPRSSEK